MRLAVFRCFALACGAGVMTLAGCGSVATTGAPPVQSDILSRIASHSWMASKAQSGALLYVSDVKSNNVFVYSYPQGEQVGTLSGFGSPRSECVDPAGNVWIADTGGDDVIEFPHGQSQPIVSLNIAGAPTGCSVNPVNGNLAVSGGVSGLTVSVFRRTQHGWGSPVRYFDSGMAAAGFCGYDASGDLFVDGVDAQGAFALGELRPKRPRIEPLKTAQPFKAPGQMEWDGTNLAIEDADVSPTVVYRFSIGPTGHLKKIGSTTLDGSKSVRDFSITGSTLVGPDQLRDRIGLWNYPDGGSPVTTITNVHAYGAVVSPAQ